MESVSVCVCVCERERECAGRLGLRRGGGVSKVSLTHWLIASEESRWCVGPGLKHGKSWSQLLWYLHQYLIICNKKCLWNLFCTFRILGGVFNNIGDMVCFDAQTGIHFSGVWLLDTCIPVKCKLSEIVLVLKLPRKDMIPLTRATQLLTFLGGVHSSVCSWPVAHPVQRGCGAEVLWPGSSIPWPDWWPSHHWLCHCY